jgi:predicted aspartyl protease
MSHLYLPLIEGGAVVDLLVGISASDAHLLRLAGQLVPLPVAAKGLIDTGAVFSCIDSQILRQLGQEPVQKVNVVTASSGAAVVVCDQFEVSLTLVHPALARGKARLAKSLAVAELDFTGLPEDALVGQDVLAHCKFVYDGKTKHFSLTF